MLRPKCTERIPAAEKCEKIVLAIGPFPEGYHYRDGLRLRSDGAAQLN
jgi:hypothetical protein